MLKQDFEQLRKRMVENQLQTNGIRDIDLLISMGKVKREYFVDENMQTLAYSDMDIKLFNTDRYLMAPVSFAKLVQLAQIKAEDVALIIGCSIGYSVAVLANLASAVVGVEENAELVKKASEILIDLDVGNGAVLHGDPLKGLASEAPYDVIIIEGAINKVPEELFKQLRDGGRLVAALENNGSQIATLYKKTGKEIGEHEMFNIKLPPLKLNEKEDEFVF